MEQHLRRLPDLPMPTYARRSIAHSGETRCSVKGVQDDRNRHRRPIDDSQVASAAARWWMITGKPYCPASSNWAQRPAPERREPGFRARNRAPFPRAPRAAKRVAALQGPDMADRIDPRDADVVRSDGHFCVPGAKLHGGFPRSG